MIGARTELALRREPDAPGLAVMRKFGLGGAFGLDAGLRIIAREHNGEEPSCDQSDKCHNAKKVLHDHPPRFAVGANGNSVAFRADFDCDRPCIVCIGIPLPTCLGKPRRLTSGRQRQLEDPPGGIFQNWA